MTDEAPASFTLNAETQRRKAVTEFRLDDQIPGARRM